MAKGKSYRARSKETKILNKHDFFPTNHGLTRVLMEEIKNDLKLNDVFLEPCAGSGAISHVIEEFGFYKIIEYDIDPKKNTVIKQDFLMLEPGICDVVITNPPFKIALQFLKKCFEWRPRSVYFLIPLDYLHGAERWDELYRFGCMNYRLKKIYPFERRPNFQNAMHHDPAGKMETGVTSFAWFHFAFGYEGEWTGKHLIIKDYIGEPTHKDQLSMLGGLDA